ncbi:MAG: hypothetical protein J7M14_07580 [Planctomycetes bacterium]|nr:hypothetical protein [Planctomycetota bacterium]
MTRNMVRFITLVTALTASQAAAQVVQTQSGQVLDAGLRQGPAGYNSAAARSRINSNLFVTGQVRGLGGFHGQVGYFPTNQLQLNLPSMSLDDFRGRSVGTDEVRNDTLYQPTPYYRRSGRVFGTGAVAAHGGRDDLNVFATPKSSSNDRRFYRDGADSNVGSLKYDPRLPTKVDLWIDLPMAAREYNGVWGIGASAGADQDGLYGRRRDSGRRNRLREAFELEQLDAWLDLQVHAEINAAVEGRITWLALPHDGLAAQEDAQQLTPAAPQWLPGSNLPAVNEDIFVDLMMLLSRQSQSRQEQFEPRKADEDTPLSRRREMTVTVRPGLGIVISALTGTGDNSFNRRMVQAEKLLKDGQFHKAAQQFEIAAIIDASNPLAHMGLFLAHFAAREPLTAAIHLRRAFAVFPPIMETRFQVDKIIGVAVRKHRMAELEKLYKAGTYHDKKSLTLLLAFMYRNVGDEVGAKDSARQLAEVASDDKIASAYAEYVLTGRRPAAKRRANR